MAANEPHPTTVPENASIDERRIALKRALFENDEVRSTRSAWSHDGGVVFETIHAGIEPEVLAVLADHGADLPPGQPMRMDTHMAIIRTE